MEDERRSMMGAGVNWGKTASGASGCRKAFFFYFSRYSTPRMVAVRLLDIFYSLGF
jgi:hypothetical protein